MEVQARSGLSGAAGLGQAQEMVLVARHLSIKGTDGPDSGAVALVSDTSSILRVYEVRRAVGMDKTETYEDEEFREFKSNSCHGFSHVTEYFTLIETNIWEVPFGIRVVARGV